MGDPLDGRRELAAGRRAREARYHGGVLAGGPARVGRVEGHREQGERPAERLPRLGGAAARRPPGAGSRGRGETASGRGREDGAHARERVVEHGEVSRQRGPERARSAPGSQATGAPRRLGPGRRRLPTTLA